MDFIFGTFASDQLKLVHHRVSRRGIQHNAHISPRDPQPGQDVTVRVRIGGDTAVEQVAIYYTDDGSEPRGNRGEVENGHIALMTQIGIEWDAISWSYVALWEGTIPAKHDGITVRYRISGWRADDAEIYADYPDVQRTAETAAGAFFDGKEPSDVVVGDPHIGTTFSYHVDRLHVPEWARDAIIYHIFVDRFYPGDGKSWLQTDDLNGICGGTLWGIRDKLDYIADLGVNCVWLSPIWIAPSHHGYDVIDYQRIDPRLGGDEALKGFVNEAHRHGIRVLLDFVPNHISNENPIFLSAKDAVNSPYRDWFTFDDSAIGYRTFFAVKTMPQVNLQNLAARQWMLDIARYWIREFDIDGYRLDYASGPALDFWTDFRGAIRAEKADAFCFGEVVDAPDALLSYVGRLDGCLDFFTGELLRKAYAWKTIDEADAKQILERHRAYYPSDFILPTFLDNHDMDRFLLIAQNDKAALIRAAQTQMRLPAPPIIFYGTEIALKQTHSVKDGGGLHMSRVPMAWGDEQDRDVLSEYKHMIAERQRISASIR
jgi:hypothetical protein